MHKHYLWLQLGMAIFSVLAVDRTEAHGIAVTIPDHDAVLAQSPQNLRFVFQAPVRITNLEIRIVGGDQDGDILDIELPRDDAGQSLIYGDRAELPIPALPANDYIVVWRGMSVGGDFVVDFFNFSVRP